MARLAGPAMRSPGRILRRLLAGAGLAMTLALASAVPGSADEAARPVQAVSAVEINERFLLGLRYLEGGRANEAIPIFLSILAIDPGLVRVRLELARAYFVVGQWSRSRREFFIVLSGDLPPAVRQNVLGFIRAIDARRGFDWNLSFGLTNVGDNRNYKTDTIVLDFDGAQLPFQLDRDTGNRVGLRATGTAVLRRPIDLGLGGNMATSLFFGGFADLTDAANSEYDDCILGLRGGLRWTGSRMTMSIAPVVRTRFLQGEHNEDQIGLEAAFERYSARGDSVFGFASFAQIDNRISEELDGQLLQARLGFRRSVASRSLIGVSIGYEDKHVSSGFDNYRRLTGRLFATTDVAFGLTLRPEIFFEQKRFKAPNPLLTANPDETSIGAALRVEKNDFFLGDGFSPFLSLGYQRTRSDIAAFSYDEPTVEFGLERRF